VNIFLCINKDNWKLPVWSVQDCWSDWKRYYKQPGAGRQSCMFNQRWNFAALPPIFTTSRHCLQPFQLLDGIPSPTAVGFIFQIRF